MNLLAISLLAVAFLTLVHSQEETDFAPQVTATCKGDSMNIKVLFNNPYNGVIHARDNRTPTCMAYGNGNNLVTMSLNLRVPSTSPDYCGIFVNTKTEEKSVQIAVRVHKTLEFAEDKYYIVTCGKPGSSRKEVDSPVYLKFYDNEQRMNDLAYGGEYKIRAEANPNSNLTYKGMKVRNCFAFNKKNFSYPLIDERGCSVDGILSRFIPTDNGLSATAMIASMFKFPEGAEVNIQCDVVFCNDICTNEKCDDSLPSIKSFQDAGKVEDGILTAAVTTFVVDPSDLYRSANICDQAGIRPRWLLWLAIILGILFLIMLLMNLFLCTAMSCSCAKTEIIENEPSVIEEYDPYRSFHDYGSKYSLHHNGVNRGYTSGASTIQSNRTIDSDHYAIVNSRPSSSRRM